VRRVLLLVLPPALVVAGAGCGPGTPAPVPVVEPPASAGPAAAPKPKKALGQDCTDGLGCESLTCSTVGNICSKTCTYDKECKDVAPDAVCRRKDEGGSWCSKPIGTPPNGSCMGAHDCQHNECLKYIGKEDQPGICSKYCATADDCPDGMKLCIRISAEVPLRVCIPPQRAEGRPRGANG
jgi:hypothetical protein